MNHWLTFIGGYIVGLCVGMLMMILFTARCSSHTETGHDPDHPDH